MEGAILHEAHLEGENLTRAHLEGASLYDARLERAKLYNARLERANLYEAHLEGAHLEGAVYDDNTVWPEDLDPKAPALARATNTHEKAGPPLTPLPVCQPRLSRATTERTFCCRRFGQQQKRTFRCR